MVFYTYDTSTIISRKPLSLPGALGSYLWSSVVLLELMASANDESDRKRLERLFRDYAKDNSLIVPDENDWALAGKVLFWLAQGRRRSAKGKSPRLKSGVSQRMALDVLLAASARRWRATVVTENWDDFKAIQRYCNVKVVRASEFFK
jgi:predicted nucleic acid-binding protein